MMYTVEYRYQNTISCGGIRITVKTFEYSNRKNYKISEP